MILLLRKTRFYYLKQIKLIFQNHKLDYDFYDMVRYIQIIVGKHLKTIKTEAINILMCQLDVYSHRTKYSCDVMLFIVTMLIL